MYIPILEVVNTFNLIFFLNFFKKEIMELKNLDGNEKIKI